MGYRPRHAPILERADCMRNDKDLFYLLDHHEYYTKDEENYYFIPTENAPQEAVEAIKRVNKRLKWDKDNDAHSY